MEGCALRAGLSSGWVHPATRALRPLRPWRVLAPAYRVDERKRAFTICSSCHRDVTDEVRAVRTSCTRRELAMLAAAVVAAGVASPADAAEERGGSASSSFQTLPSGLRVLDIRDGSGPVPQRGDRVSVHWAGFTAGYRQHRIDNTSVRDEPYSFVIGDGTTIKAFEEAVMRMKKGGLCRIEVPGELMEQLAYPLSRERRFVPGSLTYAIGPQPKDLGGSRSLDFVLDNKMFDRSPFNRTLVFDISLLAVTPSA